MEQILAFVLGVSAVAFVWVVVVAFKTAKQVKELKKDIIDLHSGSISYTDSRVDRLEQKLTSIDNNGCEPVKKKLLKG
jgi:hypothetical protein